MQWKNRRERKQNVEGRERAQNIEEDRRRQRGIREVECWRL